MKILFSEHNFRLETPGELQQQGHEVFIPKEEIKDVHEFGRDELLATLKDIKPEVLVVGLKFKIDKEIIDSVPLKAIFTRTTGLDHIDSKYCKEKGIEVVGLKGEELGGVSAVAELCMLKMLELVRRDSGELKDKTLGIVGYGRIGRMVADRATAFGMTVRYVDSAKDWEYELPILLMKSDIISLHISSTEENKNFIDKEKFEMMRDGAYFLNSSRPWLVDEEALKWALDNKLSGAWFDFDMPFEHSNLITTPHIAGKTLESSKKTEKIIVSKIIEYGNSNR